MARTAYAGRTAGEMVNETMGGGNVGAWAIAQAPTGTRKIRQTV